MVPALTRPAYTLTIGATLACAALAVVGVARKTRRPR